MPIREIETQKPMNKPHAPGKAASRAAEQTRLKALVAETDSPMRSRLVQLLLGDCLVVCAETVRRGALECYAKPISDEVVRLLILHVRSGSKMNPDGETAMRPIRRRGGRK